jgi:hypothetical protein
MILNSDENSCKFSEVGHTDQLLVIVNNSVAHQAIGQHTENLQILHLTPPLKRYSRQNPIT